MRHHAPMMSKIYDAEHRGTTPVPAMTTLVRPEQALFHVQVSVETENAAAAIPLLRRASQRLEELLPQVSARLQITDFDLPAESGKLASGTPSRLHATLVVPFAKDSSFWDRAQKLTHVDDLLRALVLEGRKQKPQLEVRRDLPVFVITDPEAYRAQLINQLHERARSVSGGAPFTLKELRFERAVTQRSRSLEEVELSLSVDGVGEFTSK
jgi:hypothetical protein